VPDKNATLDVWVVETNTVYRGVPFTVVTDWVQQGRLLEEDRLRPGGSEDWFRLGGLPAFTPYLPKAEPHRPQDKAEALEPVEVEFNWKRRPEDEDDDVDMIPLIDVSLVLLIFFVMAAATAGGIASFIKTPPAEHKLIVIDKNQIWIGIHQEANKQILYYLGQGEREDGEKNGFRDKDDLLRALGEMLQGQKAIDIRIKADEHLPFEVVRDMTGDLEKYKRTGQVFSILGEVSEKQP
jgi:biopolymer transport protein ExbD